MDWCGRILLHILCQPLGVAGHVPGDVFNAVVWRQELVQVGDSWVKFFAQNLLMFPLLTFLWHKADTRYVASIVKLLIDKKKKKHLNFKVNDAYLG